MLIEARREKKKGKTKSCLKFIWRVGGHPIVTGMTAPRRPGGKHRSLGWRMRWILTFSSSGQWSGIPVWANQIVLGLHRPLGRQKNRVASSYCSHFPAVCHWADKPSEPISSCMNQKEQWSLPHGNAVGVRMTCSGLYPSLSISFGGGEALSVDSLLFIEEALLHIHCQLPTQSSCRLSVIPTTLTALTSCPTNYNHSSFLAGLSFLWATGEAAFSPHP